MVTHLVFAHSDLLQSIVQNASLGLVDWVYGVICVDVFGLCFNFVGGGFVV